jgi:exopolyphosphatase/guanosine-5'-triphosphate,3'-diphosphate pyrophosphatase
LRVCKRILERNSVRRLRCVATEACRRAENGEAFIDRVARVTGLKLEILDQEEEARLAMLGCWPLIDANANNLMMVDIGGGSTEILLIDRCAKHDERRLGHAISLPVGVVTLAESCGNRHGGDLYSRMVDQVRDQLRARHARDEDGRFGTGESVQMLGTSGTVTTLAALYLGLRRYDRRKVDGVSISFSSIDTVSRYVRSLRTDELAAHPCIGRGRADLVIAGCAILDAVHEVWPVPGLRVADRGVREGILNSLLGRSLSQMLSQHHIL